MSREAHALVGNTRTDHQRQVADVVGTNCCHCFGSRKSVTGGVIPSQQHRRSQGLIMQKRWIFTFAEREEITLAHHGYRV